MAAIEAVSVEVSLKPEPQPRFRVKQLRLDRLAVWEGRPLGAGNGKS